LTRRQVLIAIGWAWAATIVWLSLTPAPPKVDFAQSDKVGHFIAYGTLMAWFCFLYLRPRTRVLYGIGFIAMGVGLEVIQGLLGYRTYEVFDMFANTLGVLLGWAAALVALPRIKAR
jgi:glycopeptide antibiotics resistance protein